MHDCDDQDHITPDLVDDTIGEAVRPTPPSPFRKLRPRIRVFRDAADGSIDLSRKLVAQALTFAVLVADRFKELAFGRIEEVDAHQMSPRSIRAKTSAADFDLSSPRS